VLNNSLDDFALFIACRTVLFNDFPCFSSLFRAFLARYLLLGCARLRVLGARILRWRNEELSLLPGLLVDRVDDPISYLYSQAPVNRSRPLATLRQLLSSFRASSMIVQNRCVCGDGCEYYWAGYAVERVIHYDAV